MEDRPRSANAHYGLVVAVGVTVGIVAVLGTVWYFQEYLRDPSHWVSRGRGRHHSFDAEFVILIMVAILAVAPALAWVLRLPRKSRTAALIVANIAAAVLGLPMAHVAVYPWPTRELDWIVGILTLGTAALCFARLMGWLPEKRGAWQDEDEQTGSSDPDREYIQSLLKQNRRDDDPFRR